jgi:hypothetical protein
VVKILGWTVITALLITAAWMLDYALYGHV